MLCRNISDQLLNQDGLTYTGTAEQTDLSTFLVRAEEVNDLDTCLKDLCLCGLFLKARGFTVDRKLFLRFRSFFIVDRLSQNIENSSKCLLTDRHHDRSAGRYGIHAADKTVGGTESDASYRIITEMLGNLNREDPAILCGDLNGVIDLRQPALGNFDIQNGTDDLSNFTNVFLCHLTSPCLYHNYSATQASGKNLSQHIMPTDFCLLYAVYYLQHRKYASLPNNYSYFFLTIDGIRARDDLCQLLSDGSLTRTVVLQRQFSDHLFRVVRRRIHCGHSRTVLTGNGL